MEEDPEARIRLLEMCPRGIKVVRQSRAQDMRAQSHFPGRQQWWQAM